MVTIFIERRYYLKGMEQSTPDTQTPLTVPPMINIDTDSTSINIGTGRSQISHNSQLLIPQKQQNEENPNDSEATMNNLNENENNNENDLLSDSSKKNLLMNQMTDSTSILESSPPNESRFFPNDKGVTDSTSISNDCMSSSSYNAKKKSMKRIVDTALRSKNNRTDLLARPENFRARTSGRDFRNDNNNNYNYNHNSYNNFYHDLAFSATTRPSRSPKKGNYDPLHLRPPSTKQTGFEAIPMENSARKPKKMYDKYSDVSSSSGKRPKAYKTLNSNSKTSSKASSRTTSHTSSRTSSASIHNHNNLSPNHDPSSLNISEQNSLNNMLNDSLNNSLQNSVRIESSQMANVPELPTPVSGFTVTDSNPSPKEITLMTSLDDDPIYQAMNNLIENHEIPPPEIQREVLCMMKKESVHCIVTENYDRAEAIEESTVYLRQYMQAEFSTIKAEQDKIAIEKRIEKVKKEIKLENAEWDQVLKSFKEEQKKMRKVLLKQHQEEQIKYEEKWAEPNMMIPFNKPSSQLLQLRKQQKSLALTKKFTEAKALKAKADQLQKLEAADAEKRAIAAIRNGYQILLDKQKRELECFDEHERRSYTYINSEKMKLIEPLEKLYRSLNITKEDRIDPHTMSKREVKKDERLPQATPRSKKTYNEFRTTEDTSKLNLNGVKLRRFVANKRATSAYRISRVSKY
ncbi:hypothetical protein TRFO_16937 [Tritrichomonas foetus]|uniref:Uncharacterized protein n=1 Tax=Tritrichomonas foetus TaxID=1144522 RepID=A0A1J4KPF4_9EUKA|nr:hypothetical protein TRFO_16937 [Tritrichomonas foetus]|eukprot:OHT12986.1 hypothetical protein TRFO_16937 [Tritrichomonas foetus]